MIKIYSTESCPWCTKAKDYLKSKNIDFTEYNVAEDMIARDEMIKRSKQLKVPVLDINGTILVGFNEEELNKLLCI